MLSYRFCVKYPWFVSMCGESVEDGITAEVVESDVRVTNTPLGLIVRNKQAAIEQHDALWEEYLDSDHYVVYTDGSSGKGRSGAGWTCHERRLRDDPVAIGLPGEWCALECAICALYKALGSMWDLPPITVFLDCLPVVEMLGCLGEGKWNTPLAELFAPVLSRIGSMLLVWIPGHIAIRENVVVDFAAKEGCRRVVDPETGEGVVMNLRNGMLAKELRQEWRALHVGQGHSYYCRLHSPT